MERAGGLGRGLNAVIPSTPGERGLSRRIWERWCGSQDPQRRHRVEALERLTQMDQADEVVGALQALAMRSMLDELRRLNVDERLVAGLLLGADDATLDRWAADPGAFFSRVARL
ncbi:MAG TPA: hypothetical protein VML96_06830 [Egibacteraceae bacterium]|nr:hypothetical protein [Egibacteraceae bacterium]